MSIEATLPKSTIRNLNPQSAITQIRNLNPHSTITQICNHQSAISNRYVTLSVFRNATLLTVSSQFCSTK